MRTRILLKLTALGVLCGSSAGAFADSVLYAGYPAPGGTSYTNTGTTPLSPGGLSFDYSGFNPSSYTNLYWVVDTSSGGGGLPFLGASSSDTLSFDSTRSNLGNGVLVFDGTSTVNTANGVANVFSELQVSVTDTSASALALDSPSLHTGIPTADGGALNVTGNYDVNFQFLMGASATSVLSDAAGYWANLHTTDGSGGSVQLQNSFSGGYYYTPAVPLPASVWLLLSALGGMGLMARRRLIRSDDPPTGLLGSAWAPMS